MAQSKIEILPKAELDACLNSLTGWIATGNTITKEFTCNDFLDAVAFIYRIAEAAEKADHHPDLHLTKYNHLSVVLSTHSAGGVTQKDCDLAKECDRLART